MAALLELELAGRVETPHRQHAVVTARKTGMIWQQDTMTDVVVVESPAKAKTINKYLGDGYTVLARFGHVRDLPPKDGSVRPDEDFAMDWEADDRGAKQLGAIAKALKGAKTLYLATDPDREGEAISWHVPRHAGGQARAEGRRRPARDLQRDHQAAPCRRRWRIRATSTSR